MEVRVSKKLLVVIDMQNDFIDGALTFVRCPINVTIRYASPMITNRYKSHPINERPVLFFSSLLSNIRPPDIPVSVCQDVRYGNHLTTAWLPSLYLIHFL